MRNPVRLPGCVVANRATKTSTFHEFHDHPPSGTGTISPNSAPPFDYLMGLSRLRYPIGEPCVSHDLMISFR
jgi:hypothetical protein